MPNDERGASAIVGAAFDAAIEAHAASRKRAVDHLPTVAERIIACLRGGGKILACGNGGSAGDAQHLASELVNRFERERRGLAALALTTESSTLTAIANDRGYDQVFARQIEALAGANDLLIAISTSGRSTSVVAAAHAAHRRGAAVVALTGRSGGRLAATLTSADLELRASAKTTAEIQAVHLTMIHALCRLIDAAFGAESDHP